MTELTSIPPPPPLYTARLLREHSKHGLWPTRPKGQISAWFQLLLVMMSAALVFTTLVALDYLGNLAVLIIYAGSAVVILFAIIIRRRRNE